MVLIEGTLETETENFEPGFYDMTKQRVKIKGPARVFYCNSAFEEEASESKTLGEHIMRGMSKHNNRMSSQKRNTLLGGGGQ